MEQGEERYFQYQKDLDLPIYIRLNLDSFTSEVITLLAQMRFQELSREEGEGVVARVEGEGRGRILTIEEASPALAKQIDVPRVSDRYGDESVVAGYGYRVYRYRGVAVMPYSYQSPRWSLGCFRDFGKGNEFAYKSVVSRFLSYALAPLGIAGLWGLPVDGGLALFKQGEVGGAALFVDAANRRVISVGGVVKISPRFKIFRLDPGLMKKEAGVGQEALLALLCSHSSYFDYEGPVVPVRQVLQALCKLVEGVVCSPDAFRRRADLSL